jgi:hypothetical protein
MRDGDINARRVLLLSHHRTSLTQPLGKESGQILGDAAIGQG